MTIQNDPYDCVIVGGGPAGLTAAIYLARYRRKIIVYDTENSRTLRISRSHNYPGFAKGISGPCLLKRLRQHLAQYNILVVNEAIEAMQRVNDEFILSSTQGCIRGKNVI
jgi:thioredoxin reductase (NADPH)